MTDRYMLNAWLDKVGYRVQGDIVYLTPTRTRTGELKPSSSCAVAVVATESRDGQAFHMQGASLQRFRKNPIVLYNHDYDGLPVARSLWERVRYEEHGPEIIAKPQFHRDTELSREVCRLLMDGSLSAWELGVVPERWERRGVGYTVSVWDVLEFSVVPRDEDMAHLREERRRRRISSPALVKSILEEEEVDIV